MNRNALKSKNQNKALDIFINNQNICLNWSTGTGKSRAAILILAYIFSKNSKARGCLVCKERTHIKNWKEEFIKHNNEELLKKVKPILYASLHKLDKPLDFIVLDEVHALTWKRVEYLKKVITTKTRIIALSATIPDDKRYLLAQLSNNIIYNTITLVQAIKLGLLPEPKVFIHKIKLSPHKKSEFVIRKPKGKAKVVRLQYKDRFRMNKVHKSQGITIECTEKEHYELLTERMNYFYSQSENMQKSFKDRQRFKSLHLNTGSKRKRFLANVKSEETLKIVNQFRKEGKRFLCFSGSIEQANEFNNSMSVNSNKTKKENQAIIDCFNNNQCSELFAVKMLTEGINLFNIEKGIISQLDSTMGSFYQRLGRCLRHEFPEMHLIIVEDTQDELYFIDAIKDFNKKYLYEKT